MVGRFRREGRTDRGEEKENAKALAECVWVCEGKVGGEEGGDGQSRMG